jgi:hypothetical protein
MSDTQSNKPDIQFDKAEFDTVQSTSQSACTGCAAQLRDSYFDVNGKPICEACKIAVEIGFKGGSRMARLVRAVVFGSVAATAGALIYFAILKITGYEVGLVSILVGFMVGKSVFIGSGQRGGAFYQLLAMGLTYLAIVSTYVPFILDEIDQDDEPYIAAEQVMAAGDDAFTTDVPTLPGEAPEITADAIPEGEAPESLANQAQMDVSIEQMSLLEILTGLILIAGVLFAMPFLAGMENIIGLLIIGFGLYQAWSLNRKTVLRVSGPFRIQADNS